jgi:MarC family membrane protein
MIELFLSAFITMFVVIDPPGCAPIYAGLTKGAPARDVRVMAIRATLIAGLILVGFALFGEDLLGALHIDLHSFRIAGGLMLFLIALDMVFEKRTQRREERAERIKAENEGAPEVEDVSVFPMAMPMLAGPGAIASIMLLTSTAQGLTAVAGGNVRAAERADPHHVRADRCRAADAPVRRSRGGGDYPAARRAARGARRAICDRRDTRQLQPLTLLQGNLVVLAPVVQAEELHQLDQQFAPASKVGCLQQSLLRRRIEGCDL